MKKPSLWMALIPGGAILLFIALLPGCTHDPMGIENLDTVCFQTQILPLLQTSCGMSGCHSGSGEGFSVASYQAILRSVTPGNPRASTLYQVITRINGENMMPPKQPLTQEQRTLIEVWIAQGAQDTQCGSVATGGGGNGGGNTSDSICFVQDILPLFVSSCATTSCHDGTSQGGEDHLFTLNSYATIIQHVTAGNPNASSVYRAVTGSSEEFMPPSPRPPLTATQITLMKNWIAQGALNSSCTSATCDTTGTISFASQVDPILQANCVGCHNSSSASGGVNLSGYGQVSYYALTLRNGTAILQGVIRRMPGFQAMPPSFSLDDCNIRKIELWISQGALNN